MLKIQKKTLQSKKNIFWVYWLFKKVFVKSPLQLIQHISIHFTFVWCCHMTCFWSCQHIKSLCGVVISMSTGCLVLKGTRALEPELSWWYSLTPLIRQSKPRVRQPTTLRGIEVRCCDSDVVATPRNPVAVSNLLKGGCGEAVRQGGRRWQLLRQLQSLRK